jgi:hypothetical protein
MERFIVIHGVRSGITQDEVWEGFHTLATSAVKGAKWLRSYYLPERDELICDWEALDETAIRESLKAAGVERFTPIKHICLAVHAEPELFK